MATVTLPLGFSTAEITRDHWSVALEVSGYRALLASSFLPTALLNLLHDLIPFRVVGECTLRASQSLAWRKALRHRAQNDLDFFAVHHSGIGV